MANLYAVVAAKAASVAQAAPPGNQALRATPGVQLYHQSIPLRCALLLHWWEEAEEAEEEAVLCLHRTR
jgi:hypothetical protein